MTLLMKLVRCCVTFFPAKTCLSICCVAVLTACGGDKVVVTKDDSADYRTAKQLPPLKKDVSKEPPAVVIAETGNAEPTSSQPTPTKSADQVKEQRVFAVDVVEISNDIKRLKIDAVIGPAWGHLLERLRSSGVTVHSRNKAAGRIEIGCGQIDDGSAMTERSGWKIFNKDDLIYEYCAMQLTEDDGTTFVSVQNRLGIEASGNDAQTVFDKILNK